MRTNTQVPKGMERIVDMWREHQCVDCRKGDWSKCNVNEKTPFFIEGPSGERKYFCFAGCMMLKILRDMGYNSLETFIVKQFDRRGHYDKLSID